jgi:hypothetical protein
MYLAILGVFAVDVVEFFARSTGQWRSQRATHHLAFRRAELGDSIIQVEPLAVDDPRVVELCKFHQVDPKLAATASHVQWKGAMAWDREGEEQHSGETLFAIIPEPDNSRTGLLLRERGYAEIVPVAGRYCLDHHDALILLTEYETMSSSERFWFAGDNTRFRYSAVTRFGGFSSASFCAESRVAQTESAAPSATLVPILGW